MPSKYSSDWPATEHVNRYPHCILSILPVSPSLSPCEHKMLVSISLSPSPSLSLPVGFDGVSTWWPGPASGSKRRPPPTARGHDSPVRGSSRGPPDGGGLEACTLRMHELSPLNGVQRLCMERPSAPRRGNRPLTTWV